MFSLLLGEILLHLCATGHKQAGHVKSLLYLHFSSPPYFSFISAQADFGKIKTNEDIFKIIKKYLTSITILHIGKSETNGITHTFHISLVLGWSPFCLQNCLSSLWHRINKAMEIFLRFWPSLK